MNASDLIYRNPSSRTKDMTGQVFGKLTVQKLAGFASGNRVVWECLCKCGETSLVTGKNLRSGNAMSCGCARWTHGMSKTPTYRCWIDLLRRCTNPTTQRFASYGGRGIKICKRWEVFENFLADMGPRPSKGYSIDRIDNDGNYEPGNCRWATHKEQCNNTRKTLRITFNGETRTFVEWCEITGLSYEKLRCRLRRGWSVEKALTMD